jgi:hypothetical protein
MMKIGQPLPANARHTNSKRRQAIRATPRAARFRNFMNAQRIKADSLELDMEELLPPPAAWPNPSLSMARSFSTNMIVPSHHMDVPLTPRKILLPPSPPGCRLKSLSSQKLGNEDRMSEAPANKVYPAIGNEDSLSRALIDNLDAGIRPRDSESVLLRAESLSSNNDYSSSKIDRFWAECLDSGYNSESDSIWIRASNEDQLWAEWRSDNSASYGLWLWAQSLREDNGVHDSESLGDQSLYDTASEPPGESPDHRKSWKTD